ncbi:hypothetical protein SU69_09720 [Thermosipho melanesiensis]|uniref:Outer membrane protein beta-barrel domain-containing protein n=2 Tax=Thermosipho melanesiensis TaxID=46541 RepID=A6LPA2_THEM4|nr:hypothetical protein [Thermosipho melanesiensis]ABR31753.1 hypothetical protein Tmel_1921 [Thermosipho melanesiensis BI429]APT74775.1 hypothetical protein BW47_10090 [Thermosipho melanesiensis]OOC35093.1 hypothetical protein SU69_09720 [Thermosipho melanesiensis]OOC35129.1 hypothetical protein SU70_09730 [Thermosipho melanesiensis]OOC36737.1 hypothetical protein SU68_09770 [Thermosipho melanesiensis]
MKKMLIVVLLILSLNMFSFTVSRSSWFGIRYVNPAETSLMTEYSFLQNFVMFYSYERNVDPTHNSPVSYGFSFFTNIDPDKEYLVRGLGFDFNVKIFGVTLFNVGEKLQLGFQGEVLLQKEIFQKKIGTSANLGDFNGTNFEHYNKIFVNSVALKPGIRGDFVLSKEMYLSARVYYNIQFFVGTKTECGSNVNLELQPKNSINLDFAISIPF